MCVVSFVTSPDSGWPDIAPPWVPPYPYNTEPYRPIEADKTFDEMFKKVVEYEQKSVDGKNKFINWNLAQCTAYVELLEKAAEFDKITNQPHCSDPKKTIVLHDLADRITHIGLSTDTNGERKACLKLLDRLELFIKVEL